MLLPHFPPTASFLLKRLSVAEAVPAGMIKQDLPSMLNPNLLLLLFLLQQSQVHSSSESSESLKDCKLGQR